MRELLIRSLAVLSLGLVPGVLWAAPKEATPKTSGNYLVRPSSQTVHRRESVLELRRSKDPKAGEKLIDALSDKDAMTRSLAARMLGTLKYAAARPALANVLANDPYPEVRQAAALSLRQIQDPQAVDALEKALSDSASNVRLTALLGLGYYRNPKSRPLVEAACKDKVVEVRRTAVYVLGRLEDPAAAPTLAQLIKTDSDTSVRAGAAQALGEIHAVDSKDVLRPLLKDSAKAVRASAARSLLMLGDASGLAEAKALDNDKDVAVRLIAIDALGWSKDPAAEVELKTLQAGSPADSQPAIQEALTRTQQLRKQ